MFPISIALIAVGYAIFYSGASSSKAYRVALDGVSGTSTLQGGIPLGVLLGIPVSGVTGYAKIPFEYHPAPAAQPAGTSPGNSGGAKPIGTDSPNSEWT